MLHSCNIIVYFSCFFEDFPLYFLYTHYIILTANSFPNLIFVQLSTIFSAVVPKDMSYRGKQETLKHRSIAIDNENNRIISRVKH